VKKKYQYFLIISLWMVFFAYPSFAEDIYVTGIINITMRTGPGVEHKIIAMLETGTRLELVEHQKDWSQIKKASGETGWVLSRFLSQKIPDARLVEKLKKDNQNLVSRLGTVEEENKRLSVKNGTLVRVEENYNRLKQESADFLKLNKKYKEIKQQHETQKSQIDILEDDLNNDEKLWFLSGAGVFIVGLFLGLSLRKKKKSSLL